MIRVAVVEGRPSIRARPWPSTSTGCQVSAVLQVPDPLFVSWTWPIRLPAAPSHSVIWVARSAGLQSAMSEGDGVGVSVGVGAAVAVGSGVGGAGIATATDGEGEGDAVGRPAGPLWLGRLPSTANAATRATTRTAAPARLIPAPATLVVAACGGGPGGVADRATDDHSSRIWSDRVGSITLPQAWFGRGSRPREGPRPWCPGCEPPPRTGGLRLPSSRARFARSA